MQIILTAEEIMKNETLQGIIDFLALVENTLISRGNFQLESLSFEESGTEKEEIQILYSSMAERLIFFLEFMKETSQLNILYHINQIRDDGNATTDGGNATANGTHTEHIEEYTFERVEEEYPDIVKKLLLFKPGLTPRNITAIIVGPDQNYTLLKDDEGIEYEFTANETIKVFTTEKSG